MPVRSMCGVLTPLFVPRVRCADVRSEGASLETRAGLCHHHASMYIKTNYDIDSLRTTTFRVRCCGAPIRRGTHAVFVLVQCAADPPLTARTRFLSSGVIISSHALTRAQTRAPLWRKRTACVNRCVSKY